MTGRVSKLKKERTFNPESPLEGQDFCFHVQYQYQNLKRCLWIEQCNKGIKRRFADGDKIPFDNFMVWEPVYSPINLRKVYCETNPEAEDEQQKWMRSIVVQNLMVLAFDYGEGQVGYLSIDNVRTKITLLF